MTLCNKPLSGCFKQEHKAPALGHPVYVTRSAMEEISTKPYVITDQEMILENAFIVL